MKPQEQIPSGIFRGRNFMTPRVTGYYRGWYKGRPVYAEVSKGEGMNRQPIFGVTVRYPDGEDTGMSKCLDNWAEVQAYLDSFPATQKEHNDG